MIAPNQGAELQVLLGAQEIIKRSHPTMIIEIHSRLNLPKIEEILLRANYDLEIVHHSPFPPTATASDQIRTISVWADHFWCVAS